MARETHKRLAIEILQGTNRGRHLWESSYHTGLAHTAALAMEAASTLYAFRDANSDEGRRQAERDLAEFMAAEAAPFQSAMAQLAAVAAFWTCSAGADPARDPDESEDEMRMIGPFWADYPGRVGRPCQQPDGRKGRAVTGSQLYDLLGEARAIGLRRLIAASHRRLDGENMPVTGCVVLAVMHEIARCEALVMSVFAHDISNIERDGLSVGGPEEYALAAITGRLERLPDAAGFDPDEFLSKLFGAAEGGQE